MESQRSPSTAEQILSIKIRSGREVRTITGTLHYVASHVRSLCEELGLDAQAMARISDGVRLALANVATLRQDEKILFCHCDAQFSGNCRNPQFVEENPCNVDAPFLERASHHPGSYFFPEGALTGLDGARMPGTPLNLNGQRVEIAVAEEAPLHSQTCEVPCSEIMVSDAFVEA